MAKQPPSTPPDEDKAALAATFDLALQPRMCDGIDYYVHLVGHKYNDEDAEQHCVIASHPSGYLAIVYTHPEGKGGCTAILNTDADFVEPGELQAHYEEPLPVTLPYDEYMQGRAPNGGQNN